MLSGPLSAGVAGPRAPRSRWSFNASSRPTWTQVDRRLVAEPGAQPLGGGERRPHLARRVSELHGPLDAIGKPHDSLQQVATQRLPYYGNRWVASTALLRSL